MLKLALITPPTSQITTQALSSVLSATTEAAAAAAQQELPSPLKDEMKLANGSTAAGQGSLCRAPLDLFALWQPTSPSNDQPTVAPLDLFSRWQPTSPSNDQPTVAPLDLFSHWQPTSPSNDQPTEVARVGQPNHAHQRLDHCLPSPGP
jgi:hypothetical protein